MLVLTFACAPLLHSQSLQVTSTSISYIEPDASLPDSPSYSSSQSQAAQAPSLPEATAPADETPQQRKARERAEADRQVAQQEKQRIGGIMPNFNVNMGGSFVPLTPAQKWSLSWHTIIDPYTVALHQDPRYFRKGTGSIPARVVYSALTTFICKGDNGKKQFNISNVAGNFISGGISNLYYPPDERGALLTVENGITVTLEGMLGAQLFEFSPDFSNYLQRRRDRKHVAMQEKIDAAAAAKMLNPPATPKP